MTETELRDFDAFAKAIGRRAAAFPKTFQQCVVQAATAEAQPIFCLLRAGVADSRPRELLDYGRVQLRSTSFTAPDLLSRLAAFFEKGRLPIGDIELGFNTQNCWIRETFTRSYSEYHEWPGHLYQIGSAETSNIAFEPLVARNLSPYFDIRDAIQSWIGVPVANSDSRFRQFLLFVPCFDARLDTLEFSDGNLKVKTSFAADKLQIAILATDGAQTVRVSKPLEIEQQFALMPNPTSLQVFLVNEYSEILDSFAEDEHWTTRHRVIFAGTAYPTELMAMVRGGETDRVEFKEFIRLEDKKKSNDIVKAVISFANAAGGTILIGVTDDAEIVGIDSNIPHNKDKADTFADDYYRGIRELLKLKLNRIPQIETHTEKFGDKAIFVIQVQEGSAKPYFNVQTREIFIRRGGSDVRPDPDTELRGMLTGRAVGLDWLP